MFGTVFRDKEKCKELLQRILQIKLIEIEVVEPQKSMKTTFIGKGIRIDIYAKDSDGNVYDIEMQTTEETDLHLRRHVRKIRNWCLRISGERIL